MIGTLNVFINRTQSYGGKAQAEEPNQEPRKFQIRRAKLMERVEGCILLFMKAHLAFATLIFLSLHTQCQTSTPSKLGSCNCLYKMRLTYPPSAIKDSIQGEVVVEFSVDKYCRLSNPRIKQGVRSDIDEATIKMVNGMIRDYNRCLLTCKCTSTDALRRQSIRFLLN